MVNLLGEILCMLCFFALFLCVCVCSFVRTGPEAYVRHTCSTTELHISQALVLLFLMAVMKMIGYFKTDYIYIFLKQYLKLYVYRN